MDRQLIDHLVSSGLTTRADVQRKILKAKALKIGVLSQMFDDDHDELKIATALAEYYDAPTIDEQSFDVNDTALKFLSQKLAKKHGVLPFEVNDGANEVKVAVFNPEGAEDVLKTLRTATGSDPTITIARKSWLEGAILHYYYGEPWAEKPEPIVELEPEPDVPPPAEAGINPIGRLKPKRRTIITPVSTPMQPEPIHEESAEILLDEVIASHPPTKKRQRTTIPEKRRPTPPPRPDERKTTRPGSDVDRALDDFDAFLNQSSPGNRIVDPNLSDVPGWTSPPEPTNPMNSSGLGSSGAGFDLFSEVAEEEQPSSNLESVVQTQAITIAQLRKDIDQQRAIIQALVDILADARLVSKRDIKRRIDG